jgi:hypothetical protein
VPPRERQIFQSDARWNGRPGVLTLTDHDLTFTYRSGVVRRRTRAGVLIPLRALVRIVAENGPRTTQLRLEADGEGYSGPAAVTIETEQATRFARAIDHELELIERRRVRSALGGPLIPPLTIVVQSPSLPVAIPERCRFCGSRLRADERRCPNCGAPT